MSEINSLIKRINELSQKQRGQGLDAWEKAEQEALRQEYLTFIRTQIKSSLGPIKPNNVDD